MQNHALNIDKLFELFVQFHSYFTTIRKTLVLRNVSTI
nr:MAG TPA: hypothetical protein [Caudoviricetes sp.]DAW13832.1 MAG TPA: hypothetical protein [Caudoviricetes sp.]